MKRLQEAAPDMVIAPPQFFMERGGEATRRDDGLQIAFCIHVKDRLWQLRDALPLNLAHLWSCRRWARFVLVDFGSSDGCLAWVKKYCAAAIARGFLRIYASSLPSQEYHTAIAKNTAHLAGMSAFRLQDTDIVTNLDADNLLGPGFAHHVAACFKKERCALQYYSGSRGSGTFGRIACSVADFRSSRGYDQDGQPAGNHDSDFMQRLSCHCRVRTLPAAKSTFDRVDYPHCQAIRNEKTDLVGAGVNWHAMERANCKLFKWRRKQGVERNPNGYGRHFHELALV